MDRTYIQECEESFRNAAKDLDDLELEFSSMWLMERHSQKSDAAATHAVTSAIGPHWNELKAKKEIARMRLEKAYESEKSK